MAQRARRWFQRPAAFHSTIAFALSLLLAAVFWHFTSSRWDWLPWLLAWLGAINVTTFFYYAYDKSRAVESSGRVPESVLHGMALTGGTVGAFAGMKLFRHKTIKGGFRFVFWCIVILQVGLLGWLAYQKWLA